MEPAIVADKNKGKLLFAAYEEAKRVRQQRLRGAHASGSVLVILLCLYAQLEHRAGRIKGFSCWSNTVWAAAALAALAGARAGLALWRGRGGGGGGGGGGALAAAAAAAGLTARQRRLLGLPPASDPVAAGGGGGGGAAPGGGAAARTPGGAASSSLEGAAGGAGLGSQQFTPTGAGALATPTTHGDGGGGGGGGPPPPSSSGRRPRGAPLSASAARALSGHRGRAAPGFASPVTRLGLGAGGLGESLAEAESLLAAGRRRRSLGGGGGGGASTSAMMDGTGSANRSDSLVSRLSGGGGGGLSGFGGGFGGSPYGFGASSPFGLGQQRSPMPVYQVGRPAEEGEEEGGPHTPHAGGGGGFHYPPTPRELRAAQALPGRLGLQPWEFEEMADNARRWLVKQARAWAADLDWVERELAALGVAPENLQFVNPEELAAANPLEDARWRRANPRTGQETHLLRAFRALERAYRGPGGDRAYCRHRLRELAADGLGHYRWDAGGTYQGQPWAPGGAGGGGGGGGGAGGPRPPDAELALRLCLWRGAALLEEEGGGPHPAYAFDRMHYLEGPPTKPAATLRGKQMVAKYNANPPHYKVLANGEVWEVVPGRGNLFQAVALFWYAVKVQRSGHLANVDLSHAVSEVLEGAPPHPAAYYAAY